MKILSFNIKVRTFLETHKIWKNLPYGFDKSADLLSKRQNHKEDFFQIMCASQKVRTLIVCPLNVFFFSLTNGSFVSLYRCTIVLIFKQRPSRFLSLHCRTIVQMLRLDSKMNSALISLGLSSIFINKVTLKPRN